jgi:hypothetical protein
MRKSTVISLLALTMVTASYSAVYVNEAFNGDMPTTGWTFMDNGAIVTNNAPESTISDVSSGKGLNVDITVDGIPQVRKGIGSVDGDDADRDLVISFDYNPSDRSAAQQVFILRGNNNVAFAILLALQDSIDGVGTVRNNDGSGFGDSLGVLDQDTWYHVEIVAVPQSHTGTDTFDLTITDTNGIPVISETGLGFYTDVGRYDEVRWAYWTGSTGDDGRFYVDNVDVRTTTTPTATNITTIIDQDFNSDASGFTLSGDIAERTGPESAHTMIGAGSSLHVHDQTNASNPYVEAVFVNDNADENLNILFDFQVDVRGNQNLAFRLRDAGTGIDGILLTLSWWDGTGIYNHNGSSHDPLGTVLDPGAWYRIWLSASPESYTTKTFDMTIYAEDGTVVTNYYNLPFKADIASYDSFRWYYNTSIDSKGSQFDVDNVLVGTTIPGTITPAYSWNDWLDEYAVGLGSSSNMLDDADGDLLNNLSEYALGGIPTDAADQGNSSLLSMGSDSGSNYLKIIYFMRDDAADRGLSYWLETDTDLVAAPGWTNANYEVIGTNTATGISGFDAVTNRVSIDAESIQFIKLNVGYTP